MRYEVDRLNENAIRYFGGDAPELVLVLDRASLDNVVALGSQAAAELAAADTTD